MALPLLAACDGGDGGKEVTLVCPSKETSQASADLSALSLEEVYRRMADSMTCPGYVLKAVTRLQEEIAYPEEGTLSATMAGNTWLDFSAGRARGEAQTEYVASGEDGSVVEERKDSTVSIVLGDVEYRGPTAEDPARRSGPALVCHESNSALLSLLLYCAGANEDSVTRFEAHAEYQGRRVPALATEGSTPGEVGATVFAQHLYLDVNTLLPLHNVFEGTLNEEDLVNVEVTYEYDFVPLDSLPGDFFDPAALPEPDPEADLRGTDIGMALYWLGRDFRSTGGLPALSLESAKPFPEPGMYEPGYRALLDYRLADDEFGLPAVELQLYPHTSWVQSGGSGFWYTDQRCLEKTEMNLDDRRAVIFAGYDSAGYGPSHPRPEGCPGQPPDNWGGYVNIGDAVVQIDAPSLVNARNEHIPNPYDSREGMEAIIRGLVPRPPD
jgi:hypothetical protein